MDEVESLKKKLERLERIAASAPEFMAEVDREGVLTYLNHPGAGLTLEDMLGTNIVRWQKPGAEAAIRAALAKVFEQREPASFESQGGVTGEWYRTRLAPVVENGKVERAILISHNVTEQKRAELQLREREEWFRQLVDGYIDAMAVSEQGRVIEVNAACARMFGYEPSEMTGLTAADLATPETVAEVIDRIRRGDVSEYEVMGLRRNGETFPALVRPRNVTYYGRPARISFFTDLTEARREAEERRRLEQQMQAAQKLETLGMLAGGIAHDFNNLLQVILGNVELATLQLGDHPDHAATLTQLAHARSAALRGSEIVHQMLDYTGQRPRSVKAVCLGSVVREMTELLHVSVSKNTQLVLDLPDSAPQTRADPAQLRQVIMNLITNASEAYRGQPGAVRVRVGAAELGPTDLAAMAVAPAEPLSDAVFVEVRDQGAGMTADEVRNIFDPFFTTKFAGRGLGLASVAGIVRAHGGAIRVESAPGAGSTFTVFLPAALDGPRAEPTAAPPAPRRRSVRGRVLVADDEPALLELFARNLRDFGLEVDKAADGQAALALFTATPEAFDLVVLDVTMPKLGGVDALRAMRAVRPGIPALLLSGYTDVDLGEGLDDARTLFAGKPFATGTLLANVETLLEMR
ncbi:MAG: PAS domain S-box protein [Polyangiaceae bacterium]|nr:PAS domain S-box protein [Polyangiaceae bacterium]